LVSKKTALSLCPPLKGDGLLGAVLYYDGQFDDARLCVALARTAERLGATLVNHVEAAGFMERGGRLVGAKVRDSLTGDTWEVRAKAIVNATGPMADTIRTQDDPSARPLLNTSSGAHLVLKGGVLKDHVGILIPRTQDDRVLFVLPWLGHTLIGTTDEARKPSFDPTPSHDEVEFILSEVNKHTSLPARREDILAAWAGLRPLVSARAGSTAALSRDYHVEVSEKGLLTIVGGKWTTYRRMAETAVDRICEENGWKVQKSASATQVLFGGDGWNPKGWQECLEKFPIDEGTARYWNRAYGTEGATVGHYCSQVERGFDRLHPAHPVVRGEVAYAKTFEWAVTPEDFLARRTRFQFLDERATKAVFPDVERLMGE
jgi:glycerol-3-phosphate dehydrogenase